MKAVTHLGVYGLVTSLDKVVLIKKSRGPYKGSWDLPGGKIEFGESPSETLVREISEETGLLLSESTLIDATSTRLSYTDASGEKIDFHHLGFIYLCSILNHDSLRVSGDEQDAEEACWFSLEEAKGLALSPFSRGCLESRNM